MAWIDAGVSELHRAFCLHPRARSERENRMDSSNNLLLFYAVECGLKAVWLRRRKLRTMSKTPEGKKRFGHDLLYWIKELRIPAASLGACNSFRLHRHQSASYPVSDAHQAWRYGVQIHPEDEGRLIIGMDKLANWIKEELRL